MLARQGFGQFVHVAVQKANQSHHHAAAFLRVGGAPSFLGFGGFGDSVVQLGFGGQSNLCLHFAGGGVVDVGVAARRTFDHLAVDPVSKFLHGKSPKFPAQDSLAELPGKGVVFQKRFAFLQ